MRKRTIQATNTTPTEYCICCGRTCAESVRDWVIHSKIVEGALLYNLTRFTGGCCSLMCWINAVVRPQINEAAVEALKTRIERHIATTSSIPPPPLEPDHAVPVYISPSSPLPVYQKLRSDG